MVVARGAVDGGFEVITTEKDMVRLGKGSGEMKHLTEAAIDRGVASLKRMLAVAASYEAEVWAVATSAVREARNRQDFLSRVQAETGLTVEVISGFEEARLIHLGVLQALPVFEQRLLLVDIGGGSTELLIGEGASPKAVRSVKIGSIRLTDRFFRPTVNGDGSDTGNGDKSRKGSTPRTKDGKSHAGAARPTKKMVKKCRHYVRSFLAPAAHDLKPLGFEVAVGSSGTVTAIAMLIAATRGKGGAQANGISFTRDELDDVIADLVDSSFDERLAMDGMDSRRADIIVGGALLLEGVFDAMGIESMTVSPYALREGVLYDRLAAHQPGDHRLSDLRRSNAQRLSQQLDPDHHHADVCARLAVRLFDETADVHGLGQADRELLDMAALVHNVGLAISHASHHQHTYYIVRNSDQLTGFTDNELELLAQVARYHRKSHPSARHSEFNNLKSKDKRRVSILAGLLRVAIGLDRGHTGAVGDVVLTMAEESPSPEYESVNPGRPWLIIKPVAVDTDIDVSLEAYSAQERVRLLAEALDVNVAVEGVVPEPAD